MLQQLVELTGGLRLGARAGYLYALAAGLAAPARAEGKSWDAGLERGPAESFLSRERTAEVEDDGRNSTRTLR